MDESIYFDHSATSWPKPREVIERTVAAMQDLMANAGRSGHLASLNAARLVYDTRRRLARLFGVAHSEDLVFTSGATAGINLVIKGLLARHDAVAISPMEHNAVLRPLSQMIAEREITVHELPADPLGRIDLQAAGCMARERRYALLVVAHGSNVNGIVQDLRGLRRLFADTPMLVDAAQTAGVIPIDVQGDGIDFLCASCHKGLLGPTGIGFCVLSAAHDVSPLIEGGTGSRSESIEHPLVRPDRYEAGTVNLHGIAGTAGALTSFEGRGYLGVHKRTLNSRLIEGLLEVPGVTVQSPRDGTALCVSLCVPGIGPDDLARRLEREHGILGRPGLHCAPAAHRHLGTLPVGTLRLSPGWGNSEDQIDRAVRAIASIAAQAS